MDCVRAGVEPGGRETYIRRGVARFQQSQVGLHSFSLGKLLVSR